MRIGVLVAHLLAAGFALPPGCNPKDGAQILNGTSGQLAISQDVLPDMTFCYFLITSDSVPAPTIDVNILWADLGGPQCSVLHASLSFFAGENLDVMLQEVCYVNPAAPLRVTSVGTGTMFVILETGVFVGARGFNATWTVSSPAMPEKTPTVTPTPSVMPPLQPTKSPAATNHASLAPTPAPPTLPSASWSPTPRRHSSTTPSMSSLPSPFTTHSASPATSASTAPFHPVVPNENTVTISLHGTRAWQGLSPDVVINGAQGDIAASLNVALYRITAMSYTPGQVAPWIPPVLSLQLVWPLMDSEVSSADALEALQQQLNDPWSPLWQGSITSGLQAGYLEYTVANPAALAITPSQVSFVVPYKQSIPLLPQKQTVTITNSGDSNLVITSLQITAINNPNYGTLFSLEGLPPLPVTLLPRQSASVVVSLSTAAIPYKSTDSAAAVLELQHNVPSGIHAIGIGMTISDIPSAGGAQSSWLDSTEFKVTVGALIAVNIATGVCICWLCRRCKGRGSSNTLPPARQRVPSEDTSQTAPATSQATPAVKNSKVYDMESGDEKHKLPSNSGAAASNAHATIEMRQMSAATSSTAPAPAASTLSFSGLTVAQPQHSTRADPIALKSKPALKAAEFESKWAALTTVELWGATLKALPTPGSLEQILAVKGIACIASGALTDVSKYYFYAEEEQTNKLCMAEVSVTRSSCRLSAVMKAADASIGPGFVEVFKAALLPYVKTE